jgi:DNA-binding LytR/AlgR family response regulator
MNIVIFEDERSAVNRLRKMVAEIDGAVILHVLDTVKAGVQYLDAQPPVDLLLMDIQLGDGMSFEILDKVAVKCPVIFITAFDEYAIKAFKYNSIDYLLKPINQADLEAAVTKYQNRHQRKYDLNNLNDLLQQFKNGKKEYKTRFLIKKGGKYISIGITEIALIYTKERIHYIKTFSGTDYVIDSNLDELELQLNPVGFFRVNRQFIVAHSAINQIVSWFDGKLKLNITPAAYEDIVISRRRSQAFKKWLNR